jgi:hypothetical protein
LIFTTKWMVAGGTYYPPLAGNQIIGRVGVPFVATPVHTGIPESCAGQGIYSVGPTFPLQSGLAVNAATGEISGTPKAAGGVVSGGFNTGAVLLSFPGFQSTVVLQNLLIEP